MHAPERVDWEIIADGLLDRRQWAHQTSRTVAQAWDFGIRTNVAALGAHLGTIFQEMAADGEPEH
jgi:hypothetical protein